MSFWFYGYFNPGYLLIIGSSILVNYGVSILLRRRDGQPLKRLILVFGLLFNLGLLFYFKYFDFFLENINVLFGQSFALRAIVLPLGISFFTF